MIHGYKTMAPIPLGQAASWDPELVRQAARIAAREAAVDGIHWTFAPMMDIARDPRWGRIAESLGGRSVFGGRACRRHGPRVSGRFARRARFLAACAKHYVGYGAAEAGRDYNATWIPENLLRDIYLQPFRAAKEAGVADIYGRVQLAQRRAGQRQRFYPARNTARRSGNSTGSWSAITPPFWR